VRWNPFHPRTFISASADWTVKIWDSDIKSPIMSFDLGQAMCDVVWSPFSSSVFIALSLEKTFAYDLEQERHTRSAEIRPINKNLTNLAFNPVDPIFLVGDVMGSTVVIKLSQNLAKRKYILFEVKKINNKSINQAPN
jgi:dynein intermediate chain 1, axonemal